MICLRLKPYSHKHDHQITTELSMLSSSSHASAILISSLIQLQSQQQLIDASLLGIHLFTINTRQFSQ